MAVLLLCAAFLLEILEVPLAKAMQALDIPYAGGAVGHLVGSLVLRRLFGDIGTGILIVVVVLIAAVCLFDFEVSAVFRDPKGVLGPRWAKMKAFFSPTASTEEILEEEAPVPPKRTRRNRKKEKEVEEEEGLFQTEPPAPIPEPVFPEPEPEPEPPPPSQPAREPSVFKTPSTTRAPKPAPAAESEDFVPRPQTGEGPRWVLPPVTLLQEVKGGVTSDSAREEYLRTLLRNTLKEFGVDATITDVQRGPVVTSFEVLPAPGVRVEKIAGLSNNLALALKAESIRVQAPIPGKGVVGIEVPNNKTNVVFARDIIESNEWAKSKDWVKGKIALPLCLGVDVSGNRLVGDLADMPHLLIAGATGSGKSVDRKSVV